MIFSNYLSYLQKEREKKQNGGENINKPTIGLGLGGMRYNIGASNPEQESATESIKKNERLKKELDKASDFMNGFISFEIKNELADALKSACTAWCDYKVAMDLYDYAKVIINSYYGEHAIMGNIEKIQKHIYKIEAYPESDFEAVKGLGYDNYMFSIKNLVKRMESAYEAISSYENTEYSADKPLSVKGFLKIECSNSAMLSDLPVAIDSCKTARDELLRGETKTFQQLIAPTYAVLKDESFINKSDIALLKENEEKYKQATTQINMEIEKAKHIYESVKKVVNDEWCEQFNPTTDEDEKEINRITTSADLKRFYIRNTKELFEMYEENKQ